MNRRRVVAGITGLSLSSALSPLAAQTVGAWPNRPIRVIVPYPAGGGTDIIARLVAERLQSALGQSIVVENRAGANGMIGSEAVARSAADGYTLVVVAGTHVLNPYLYKKVPYDAIRDFTPISVLASSPMVIVAGLTQPFKTVRELIDHARANPKTAIGNSEATTMLSGEMFKLLAKVDMTPVAYKGGGPLMTDVIGGHVPVGVTSVLTALSHHKAGKLRVLGVGSKARTAAMMEVPTVIEGGLAAYEAASWYAMLGPANLPREITQRLSREVARIMADPAIKERVAGLGGDVMGNGPEETLQFLNAERDKWSRVIREAGIQPSE
jgi:tripartite-type tricarboxylate transporter receptor subunit TctC